MTRSIYLRLVNLCKKIQTRFIAMASRAGAKLLTFHAFAIVNFANTAVLKLMNTQTRVAIIDRVVSN